MVKWFFKQNSSCPTELCILFSSKVRLLAKPFLLAGDLSHPLIERVLKISRAYWYCQQQDMRQQYVHVLWLNVLLRCALLSFLLAGDLSHLLREKILPFKTSKYYFQYHDKAILTNVLLWLVVPIVP